MGMESKYVWMDGELVEFEKATIHILTPALHYQLQEMPDQICFIIYTEIIGKSKLFTNGQEDE